MAGPPKTSNLELLALAWSLGWRIAAGVLVGYFLDQRLGCAPLLTLLLSITALAVGVAQILRVLAAGDRHEGPRS